MGFAGVGGAQNGGYPGIMVRRRRDGSHVLFTGRFLLSPAFRPIGDKKIVTVTKPAIFFVYIKWFEFFCVGFCGMSGDIVSSFFGLYRSAPKQFYRAMVIVGIIVTLLCATSHTAQAQDAPLPTTVSNPQKLVTAADAQKLATDIDYGLLAIFPPDSFSGIEFRGQTTVVPAGNRFAINTPRIFILKPELGVRIEIGSINAAAKLLVDPSLERNLKYEITLRLPNVMPVLDATDGKEISQIVMGDHEIRGIWETGTQHFSSFKATMAEAAWQQEQPADPTDPDFNKPDYKPKPRRFIKASNITIESSLGRDADRFLSGPIKMNFKDFQLFSHLSGDKIFSAQVLDWFIEGRKVDLNQYYSMLEKLDRVITTGFRGYPAVAQTSSDPTSTDKNKPDQKIDEAKRTQYFDGLTAEMEKIKPLFDGVDNVITLTDATYRLPGPMGEIGVKNFTFGCVINGMRSETSQIGFRVIGSTGKLTPAMKRPDLFPKDMDLRVTINDIANIPIWETITNMPADMKKYGEMPGLDYAWNKFFFQLARNRAVIEVDKSFIRARDMDLEMVATASFVPSASYLIAGAANVNLIGIDELTEKIRRVARDMQPKSAAEQEERRKLNDMAKSFATLRDSGNRGLQREKGMTRRYNVVVSPDGAVRFNGNDAVALFFQK